MKSMDKETAIKNLKNAYGLMQCAYCDAEQFLKLGEEVITDCLNDINEIINAISQGEWV